jgi:capsid assembly protease
MPYMQHIMTRLIHQPLLAMPEYAEAVMTVLAERVGVEPIMSQDQLATFKRPARDPYVDREAGIAVLPLVGGLVHRSEYLNPSSGMTGYTAIQNTLKDFRDTRAVKGILIDVDSPGGEVSGLHELGEFIADMGKDKPVFAIANGLMASAAYWLASGASRIYAAPQAAVGSIGVLTMHIDKSKELERKGQKVTLIHAGRNKVAGNPYEALPDEVRAGVQARVDELYSQFVATVAERRGLEAKVIRKTEAGVFSPEKALEIGLIDGIATFGDAVRALQARVNTPAYVQGFQAKDSATSQGSSTQEGNTMAERLLYGEDDLAKARKEGESSAAASTKTAVADAVASASKAIMNEMASAIASLFPDNARAATFVDALNDGASVSLAQKVASRVDTAPAVAAADPTNKPNEAAAVERVFASVAPNVQADNAQNKLTDREARFAELKAVGKGFSNARGYAAR